MAENLKTLKGRIRTAVNISQIAKAMEMISASKIRRAKETVEHHRPYAERITTVIGRLLRHVDLRDFSSPYAVRNPSPRRLVIALSTDKGLCGALPDTLNRKLYEFGRKDTAYITVGKKADQFAVRAGLELLASFPMGTALPKFSAIYPVLDIVNREYCAGNIGEVHVVFTEFRSLLSQVPVAVRLLPVGLEKIQTKEEEIVYTFEPDAATVLEELLPFFVEVELYNAFINAYTSEQAARMVSMQNAKNNALDIREQMTLAYNKLRQAKITGEILDITNSQFA